MTSGDQGEAIAVNGPMVCFVCVAPGHSRANGTAESTLLTIVAGEWALCAWGGTDGHVWDETEGLDIRMARNAALRRREPVEDQQPTGAASSAS
ncbi:MAG TPA: hypothetical protein VM070_02740 [Candidatus Saccharimonadales bacterium]|nr:hypothetical protein [Candidatus Saccharimonadales bacterium]